MNEENLKDDIRQEEACKCEKPCDCADEHEACECDENKECDCEGACGCECSDKSADEDAAETKEAAQAEAKAADPEEEAMNVKFMRLMADFQNFKRRTEKEKNDIYAFANEKIISELLNVIDNFERALAAGDAEDNFYKGMEMILKQLQGVLEKAGASEIEALGKEFDPNFHNAIMMEDSDEYESGHVTAVLQKGYILNSKVIRPSMVKVAN